MKARESERETDRERGRQRRREKERDRVSKLIVCLRLWLTICDFKKFC